MDRRRILPTARIYEEPGGDGKSFCAATSSAAAQRCPPGIVTSVFRGASRHGRNVFSGGTGDGELRRAAPRASAQPCSSGAAADLFADTPGVFARRALGAHSPYGPHFAFLPQRRHWRVEGAATGWCSLLGTLLTGPSERGSPFSFASKDLASCARMVGAMTREQSARPHEGL